MKKIICLIVTALVATSAVSEGGMTVMGAGVGFSCGTYVSEAANRESRLTWVLGYLSGFNVSKIGKTDFLEAVDSGAIRMNILNYCQKNPLEKFTSAVQATTYDLIFRK